MINLIMNFIKDLYRYQVQFKKKVIMKKFILFIQTVLKSTNHNF